MAGVNLGGRGRGTVVLGGERKEEGWGMIYVVKGRSIRRGIILEEVAGYGCVFDDERGCILRSRSMSIDHDDKD